MCALGLSSFEANASRWEEFKQIRQGHSVPIDKTINRTALQDPTPIHCQPPTAQVGQDGQHYHWFDCTISGKSTHHSPYDLDYPLSYVTPTGAGFSAQTPARVKVTLHDASANTDHQQLAQQRLTPSKQVIDVFPREQSWQGKPGGKWVFSGNDVGAVNNYNGQQIAASLDHLISAHGNAVDIDKGLHLRGSGMGGTGVLHQALVLPRYQSNIAIVEATGGWMNASAQRDVLDSLWGTKQYHAVDFRQQWRKAQHIHFHYSGSSGSDGLDTGFIALCEQRKISCSLAWHAPGAKPVSNSWQSLASLWQSEQQNVSLDRVLPVITRSSANYHGEDAGYHNRGISWRYDGIRDTASELRIPLKYTAAKNIGHGLPDQPDAVTFSLTPRHVRHFPLTSGQTVRWQFGEQSSHATVSRNGLLTINNLRLNSGASYTDLVLTITTPSTSPPQGTGELVYPIVYTRVPRTHDLHSVTLKNGSSYSTDKWGYLDTLPEVARIHDRFNGPGQLVIQQPDGQEKVIYDCMNRARPCVPLDPMVSFDGTKIAFSVYSADGLTPPWPEEKGYPNRQLNGVNPKAQIFIYDIASDTLKAWPHHGNNLDISPAWLPNGDIMFASSRNPIYPPKLNRINPHPVEPRLFIAKADGTHAVDISQHEVTGAIHPFVMSNGDVAYSSHWTSHNLAYVHNNGGVNWPGTIANFWNIMATDRRGGDFRALLGAHKNRMTGSNPKSQTIKALHFLGQRANDDLCTVNYYRANNLGLGDVVCWPLEDRHIEGPAPDFIPRGLYSAATWSTSEDRNSLKGPDGKYLGKVGWPEGTEDDQLLLSVGRGQCSSISFSIPSTPDSLVDDIGCDVGIYKTTRIPSTDMSDLGKIVDRPQWHEFGARSIRPREVATPELSNTSDGSCVAASSDAGRTDAHNYKGYRFNKNYGVTANNGSEIDGLSHDELAAIRFYKVLPLQRRNEDPGNHTGHRLALLGDVKLLADKSFTAQLPCNVPYLMVGLDANGRAIKRDQVPQSLRPGEKRICTGCHLHSETGRPYERSLAFTATPKKLVNASPVPTFTKDIKPLLQQRCSQCHSDDVPIGDYNKLVLDWAQKYVPDERKVQFSTSANPNRAYGLQKPYSSKYVNTMYARESLLYWKAANQRSDGRTDNSYDNDIDFGANHPTTMTARELKLLGDWLDSGATR